ncbi:MAG: ribonuclease H-like domain-containing protein [Thaumarchaeota archaeon]|nr:ribonuclease H-like domain-containing protein [Nitrososphaerota archaeon]
MGNYYLDIETTGLDPVDSKIITIQYVELERGTGKQIGDVKILKEWEHGEKEMIAKFIEKTPITSFYGFDFVSIGYNLGFEHKFLFEKTKQHQLDSINIFNRPFIDLHSIGIMMNKGEFLGSGLDKLTGKPQSGSVIPDWYVEQDYTNIENYIIKETEEFVKFLVWTHDTLPSLRSNLDNVMNS